MPDTIKNIESELSALQSRCQDEGIDPETVVLKTCHATVDNVEYTKPFVMVWNPATSCNDRKLTIGNTKMNGNSPSSIEILPLVLVVLMALGVFGGGALFVYHKIKK